MKIKKHRFIAAYTDRVFSTRYNGYPITCLYCPAADALSIRINNHFARSIGYASCRELTARHPAFVRGEWIDTDLFTDPEPGGNTIDDE